MFPQCFNDIAFLEAIAGDLIGHKEYTSPGEYYRPVTL